MLKIEGQLVAGAYFVEGGCLDIISQLLFPIAPLILYHSFNLYSPRQYFSCRPLSSWEGLASFDQET